MDSHVYDIQIRVLVCKEDGEFVARALELDLLGYGQTETEAVTELKSAVEAQLTFSHQMKDASMLACEADPEFFKRWEEANSNALRTRVFGDKSMKLKAKATIFSFSEKVLKSLQSRSFKQASAPVCA